MGSTIAVDANQRLLSMRINDCCRSESMIASKRINDCVNVNQRLRRCESAIAVDANQRLLSIRSITAFDPKIAHLDFILESRRNKSVYHMHQDLAPSCLEKKKLQKVAIKYIVRI